MLCPVVKKPPECGTVTVYRIQTAISRLPFPRCFAALAALLCCGDFADGGKYATLGETLRRPAQQAAGRSVRSCRRRTQSCQSGADIPLWIFTRTGAKSAPAVQSAGTDGPPRLLHERNFDMKSAKRILALAGVIIILGLYLVTFFLGIFGSPNTRNWLMAAVVMTVVVPVLIYAMLLVARVLSRRGSGNNEKKEREEQN
jgi:hypothetical protein